ncbi:sugar transferase [Microbacterium bovistercoris]|uniref:Sugar transferase n=1 Tax=Microbacterium bovistercoris TaxID=2293570 RepID=A0A371NYF7_9MICO|nr:sugar transferase [Microbacterium bovistercoris]REJ08015.1 sugar transferase [Microbacterium bovistercoris]
MRSAHDWRRAYATRLRITDAVIVFASVFAATQVRFGDFGDSAMPTERLDVTYTMISIAIALAWLAALSIYASRDHKVIGNGSTEYKRVADSTLRVFGVLAIIAFAFKLPISRGYLLVALPVGMVLLIAGRWAWRSWLHRQRAKGAFVQRAVLMGERSNLVHVAAQIMNEPSVGIQVVGAVTERGTDADLVPGIPVIANYDDVMTGLDGIEADTLVFSGSDKISPRKMRELGWNLESRRIDLIVAPALTDVAGPRIHSRPVAGLPLIYVDFPAFEGSRFVSKRAADILLSSLGLVLLAPFFLVVSLLIRRDGGKAFFRQERVGLQGKTFKMLKFRSMVVDAEDRLDGLLDRSEGNGVLFKMKSDPRITSIGRWLRRYSIDELPQLINVFRGEMSLVGPRPPLLTEVERYDDSVRRRFLVKPGITGLWQVSGRSDLSWDDSVRLDLYYVENWSSTGDLVILWRTIRAVIAPEGAY